MEMKAEGAFVEPLSCVLHGVELLEKGKIDVASLVSHQLPLEDFASGVELIGKGIEDVLKVVILPSGTVSPLML